MKARVKNAVHVRAARQRLVKFGLAEGAVKGCPDLQVILLDEKYAAEELRDEAMKALALPYRQAEAVLAAWPKQRADELLLRGLVAPWEKVRKAQARLEQRFALLRHVEALRLYAAAHRGQLPQQLSDIPLPLPAAPAPAQPFSSTLKGGTAT